MVCLCIAATLPDSRKLPQDVFGRRSGAAALARRDASSRPTTSLVEVEEMGAFPGLHAALAGTGDAASARDRRVRRGPRRRYARGALRKITRARRRHCRRDARPCRRRSSFRSRRHRFAPCQRIAQRMRAGTAGTSTIVTSPMRMPSSRISSIVSLIVPLTEPSATTMSLGVLGAIGAQQTARVRGRICFANSAANCGMQSQRPQSACDGRGSALR